MATEKEIEEKLVEILLRGLPTFNHVVARLKKGKHRDIKRVKCSVAMDHGPSSDSNEWFSLDADVECLKEPNYWIPVVEICYQWCYYPCCPPWLQSRASGNTTPQGIPLGNGASSLEQEEQIARDPEAFLRSELSALQRESPEFLAQAKAFMQAGEDVSGDELARMQELLSLPPESIEQAEARIAANLLESAMKAGNKDRSSLSAIARAYLAGRHAERAEFFGADVPKLARQAKVFVSNAGKGRPSRAKRAVCDLKQWEKRVLGALRNHVGSPTTNEIIDALEKNGLLTKLDKLRIEVEGEPKPMARETFRKKLRRLKEDFL